MNINYFTRPPDEIVFTFNRSEFVNMFKSIDYLNYCINDMVKCAKLYNSKLITIEYKDYENGMLSIKSIRLKEE